VSDLNALKCLCGGDLSQVVDSRPAVYGDTPTVRRRRKCDACGEKIMTYELPAFVVEQGRDKAIRAAVREMIKRMLDEVLQ
jgi:transcriptional regulator NrdR family protein